MSRVSLLNPIYRVVEAVRRQVTSVISGLNFSLTFGNTDVTSLTFKYGVLFFKLSGNQPNTGSEFPLTFQSFSV